MFRSQFKVLRKKCWKKGYNILQYIWSVFWPRAWLWHVFWAREHELVPCVLYVCMCATSLSLSCMLRLFCFMLGISSGGWNNCLMVLYSLLHHPAGMWAVVWLPLFRVYQSTIHLKYSVLRKWGWQEIILHWECLCEKLWCYNDLNFNWIISFDTI